MAIVRRSMGEMLGAAAADSGMITSNNANSASDSVRVIMGIDPGTVVMGYAVIEVRGRDKVKVLVTGVVKLGKFDDRYVRLGRIFERIAGLVQQYGPTEMALEAPFYGQNVQSMLKLGRAQGVAMAAAFSRGVPVFEYAPRRVKQAITGRGAASKEQVAALLKHTLGLAELPAELDATDALAVAVCHSFSANL